METRQRKPQTGGKESSGSGAQDEPSTSSYAGKSEGRPMWQKIVLGVVGLFFLYVLWIIVKPPPYEIHTYELLPEPPVWTGPLEKNNLLANAERLLQDVIHGPESMVFVGDKMYGGQSDGWVVEVDLNTMKLRELVRFGKPPCTKLEHEPTCGRPLGMRLDKQGNLWVVDAYLGIFKITNLKTGEYEMILSADVPINGKKPKLLNDLDFGEDGIIYFTDSSTLFQRYVYTDLSMSGAHTGRLVRYNTKTKELKVLVDKLAFPNGMTMDRSGNVLYTDSFYARIDKYDVKTGKVSPWAKSLPGHPDNIRYMPSSGTYLVAMSNPREAGKTDKMAFITQAVRLRGFLSKVVTVSLMESMQHIMGALGLEKSTTLVVEMNEQGQIIKSFQDHTGTGVPSVTEAHIHKGAMYLGNFGAHYVGRVKGLALAGQKK